MSKTEKHTLLARMKRVREQLRDDSKKTMPLLGTVLSTLDWDIYTTILGYKAEIECRDEEGNVYTVKPMMNIDGSFEYGGYMVQRMDLNPRIENLT
jgi:hypothetical protein